MEYLALDEYNRLALQDNTLDGSEVESAFDITNALRCELLAKQNRYRAGMDATDWTVTVLNAVLFKLPIDTVYNDGDLFHDSDLVIQSPGVYQASAHSFFFTYQPIAPDEPNRLRAVELVLVKNGAVYSTLGGLSSEWFWDTSQTPLPAWMPCRLMSGHLSGADWLECKAGDRIGLALIFHLDVGYDIGFFKKLTARITLERTGDIIESVECC